MTPMDETIRLIERAHQGDKTARDKLVTDNMGLVWSIVRRLEGAAMRWRICSRLEASAL